VYSHVAGFKCVGRLVGVAVVGLAVVGDGVVGDGVVGDRVVGADVVGLAVVGDGVVGDAVVGDAVVGDAVVGDAVVGDAVVGTGVGACVVGASVVGTGAGVGSQSDLPMIWPNHVLAPDFHILLKIPSESSSVVIRRRMPWVCSAPTKPQGNSNAKKLAQRNKAVFILAEILFNVIGAL